MPVRIAIGMAVTVVCFAIAGRRFHWLSRLIRAGKPAPGRTRTISARRIRSTLSFMRMESFFLRLI